MPQSYLTAKRGWLPENGVDVPACHDHVHTKSTRVTFCLEKRHVYKADIASSPVHCDTHPLPPMSALQPSGVPEQVSGSKPGSSRLIHMAVAFAWKDCKLRGTEVGIVALTLHM